MSQPETNLPGDEGSSNPSKKFSERDPGGKASDKNGPSAEKPKPLIEGN